MQSPRSGIGWRRKKALTAPAERPSGAILSARDLDDAGPGVRRHSTPTMRTTKLIFAIALAAIGVGVTWLLRPSGPRDWPGRAQNVLPADTRRVLDNGERFVLLSLEPYDREKATWALGTNAMSPPDPTKKSEPPKKKFHDYVILGSVEIRDGKEREELLRALYKGIADSEGRVAACFNPRHGISATLAGETVDLVICFECLSIQTYAKNGKGVLTTGSPLPTFNGALRRAGLPIANDE